jgi:hypothetical protein
MPEATQGWVKKPALGSGKGNFSVETYLSQMIDFLFCKKNN